MNENTKIEVAREVMNAMIARYGKDGYDRTNKILMMLLHDEQEMNNFNFATIDKIINTYGPMVKEVTRWTNKQDVKVLETCII